MTVRTRFAPSPTGYMHIGGMRTALFNWLWARHNGGQFILRIDDTDQQRNVEAALAPILDAFRWLGLDWDEGPEVGGPHGPYFQSQRGAQYGAALRQLLESGQAYRDFDPPELIQADRQAAEQEKRNYLNIRRSLDLSADEVARLIAEGRPHVIRLLVDRDRKVAIDDVVRGHVEWDAALISDPVICRQDGSPLYNFATVVDDAALEITHVIRAEEHLTNTAVQVLLFEALGHALPTFAHIPFVAAPGTSKKLSKRDLKKYSTNPQFKKLFEAGEAILSPLDLAISDEMNPVMVAFYRELGFLPEAVLNALSRLGWSLDDKTEQMSLEFVTEHFTLDRVVKGAAGFDADKLLAFQEHWMGRRSTEERVAGCLPYLLRAGWLSDPIREDQREFVGRLVSALGDRLKLFGDILRYDEYFVDDDQMPFDEKAFDKRIRKPEDAVPLLREYRAQLAAAETFDAPSLDAALHAWVESKGIQMGQIIHALRVATTGKPAGPGMFDCLALLGKERCLARIDRAINAV
ncbi:MAG: glutamate--tRNA ligase [Planctomycetaceae bacterium]